MKYYLYFMAVCCAISITYSVEPRIFGGKPLDINSHKYLVKIESDSDVLCSGSILNSYWIISAAHCFYPIPKIVRISHFKSGKKQVIAEMEKVFIHPDYINFYNNIIMSNDESSHDVALLRIKKPINFDNFVNPIKLAHTPIVENDLATIAGFGISETMDFKPRGGTVRLYYCGKNSKVLCSKGKIRGADGDSGGPLVVKGRLAGVTSGSCSNANKNNNCETIFANILENDIWIKNTMSMV